MGNRSRLVYRAKCDVGQSETIDLTETLPFNATLLQISIKLASAVTSAIFRIWKDSVAGAQWDVDIFEEDPSIGGITDYVVTCDTEFLLNDKVRATFSNPQNVNVGLELIFREGD